MSAAHGRSRPSIKRLWTPSARRKSERWPHLQSWRATLAAQQAIEAEQIAVLADRNPSRRGIPGFGPQVVAAMLGELGDLPRFDDLRQEQKKAELNLTQQSSGYQGQTNIPSEAVHRAGDALSSGVSPS